MKANNWENNLLFSAYSLIYKLCLKPNLDNGDDVFYGQQITYSLRKLKLPSLLWLWGLLGFSRKKPNWGIENMEFPGLLKKAHREESMQKFQGSIKKEVKCPGMIKKKSSEIYMGLGFWLWNFQGV